ncbi:MAG: hypothetical protein AAFP70_16545 [Calditrichota bacterium]
MGGSAILDIVSASLIGGILLIIAISVSDSGTQEFYNQNSDQIMQSNLTQMSRIVNSDFSKMGFGIPEGDTIVFTSTQTRFKYIAQLNQHPDYNMLIDGVTYFDNIPDTIEYEITLADTFSIADLTVSQYNVTRTVKMPPSASESFVIGKIGNLNVFEYFDLLGNPVLLPTDVRDVEAQFSTINPRVILSPELVVQDLGTIADQQRRQQELKRILRPSYWKQVRFASRNLRR